MLMMLFQWSFAVSKSAVRTNALASYLIKGKIGRIYTQLKSGFYLPHRQFLPRAGHTGEVSIEIYTHFFGQKTKYHTVRHGDM